MPLVSVTVVVPGPDKNLPWVQEVFDAASREVVAEITGAQQWPVWVSETYAGPTGPELLLAVDADPLDLKRAMVALESGDAWGRLWDVDVVVEPELVAYALSSAGEGDGPLILTRAMVGASPRQCLVCGRPSPECARSRRHSVEQLLRVAARVVDGTVGRITDAAYDAVLREARLTPKPGLVDAHDAGSHDDMTLTTFERSATALRPSWAACARAGVAGAGTAELVELGLAAEADMLAATAGVNTHKGAVYALGLLCAAVGADPGGDVDGWCAQVAAWTSPGLAGWTASLASREPVTHGEQAYVALGLTGARGLAASGYAPIREQVLPAFRARLAQHDDLDDALRWALVQIMAVVPDTNVYARGGADAVGAVQAWAADLAAQDPSPETLVVALRQANIDFSTRRWSPGGAADLLAVTWFLHAVSA